MKDATELHHGNCRSWDISASAASISTILFLNQCLARPPCVFYTLFSLKKHSVYLDRRVYNDRPTDGSTRDEG